MQKLKQERVLASASVGGEGGEKLDSGPYFEDKAGKTSWWFGRRCEKEELKMMS